MERVRKGEGERVRKGERKRGEREDETGSEGGSRAERKEGRKERGM